MDTPITSGIEAAHIWRVWPGANQFAFETVPQSLVWWLLDYRSRAPSGAGATTEQSSKPCVEVSPSPIA